MGLSPLSCYLLPLRVKGRDDIVRVVFGDDCSFNKKRLLRQPRKMLIGVRSIELVDERFRKTDLHRGLSDVPVKVCQFLPICHQSTERELVFPPISFIPVLVYSCMDRFRQSSPHCGTLDSAFDFRYRFLCTLAPYTRNHGVGRIGNLLRLEGNCIRRSCAQKISGRPMRGHVSTKRGDASLSVRSDGHRILHWF